MNTPKDYRKVLKELSRKILRTLDVDTIWQQTVDGLGETLQVSRCLIVSYDCEQEICQVEAEYCQASVSSLLDQQLSLDSQNHWKQALEQDEILAIARVEENPFQVKSTLVISTLYQNQRNALICLQQCDHHRSWQDAEQELVRELAEQVETAIAHARLYQELQEASKKAEEAARLKSDFLASTSHELLTPLNGAIGFLSLVLGGMAEDPQEQKEFIEQAHNSAVHLLSLIQNILNMSDIEDGKVKPDFTDVNLDKIFKNVERLTRGQALEKNLSFKIDLTPTQLPILVYGNYYHILQVMLNLVSNAIKFTHEGSITINTKLVNLSKPKPIINGRECPGEVEISIKDTGIGVDLTKQELLFDKFSQVNSGETSFADRNEGTGLGLAISKQLVETMGGKIEFSSIGVSGCGSTVTFSIPLYEWPLPNHKKA